jgi:putative nucleotidyltransferase with HDIG domain
MFMSFLSRRGVSSRRESIRKDRPDTIVRRFAHWRATGVVTSVLIAATFAAVASTILTMREQVVPYRPGQYVAHDIVSRVEFVFPDKDKLAAAQRATRAAVPRIYAQANDGWKVLEERLLALPDRVAPASTTEDLPAELRSIIDSGALTKLRESRSPKLREAYIQSVKGYVAALNRLDPVKQVPALAIVWDEARRNEMDAGNDISLQTIDANGALHTGRIRAEDTLSPRMRPELEQRLAKLADENFELALRPKIVALTLAYLKPTHVLDEAASADAQNRAAAEVPASAGHVTYPKGQTLVPKGEIDDRYWQLLRAENDAFIRGLDTGRAKTRVGLVGLVLMITIAMSWYVSNYQHKIVKKHARGIAIAALLLSMLLLAQLAGVGTSPVFVFGLAPTILVAMILTIAYDQRFASGIASLHAVLVTLALGQGLSFLVILLAGATTCCYLLSDIRTRSKLVEVGFASGLAMMLATLAAGLMSMDPVGFILKNCLYAGAAGMGAGFITLGILPFIEKVFRITTSMTLLELADVSHPLLRRLSVEAPGTYNHSLQVATISESAAEAIKVNSLLCRVASYYHDVGKINKADYFCENQSGGANRHLNLSPSVSLLIIIGHVKDGVELAKEYNMPTSIIHFIQQHHGTTLVEFFYHQACTQQEQKQPDLPAVSEMQYRYPGPKPRSKEAAIVMIADAVESATRAMQEPTPQRVESLVEDIIMKRLLDGQFDECELTMREIQQLQRSCVKSLLAIYHGRIPYPSTANVQSAPSASHAAVRTA